MPEVPRYTEVELHSNPEVPINIDDVFLCKHPADLVWPLSLFYHHWIKTNKYESGKGGRPDQIPGQGNSDAPYTKTQTVDHVGQYLANNAACDLIPDMDVDCVNEKIRPG